jgi:putative transposase
MSIEKTIRAGWFVYWQKASYQIVEVSTDHLTLDLCHCDTGIIHSEALENLLLTLGDAELAPIFAPSHQQLLEKVSKTQSPQKRVHTEDLPQALLDRADRLIQIVETVERDIVSLEKQDSLVGIKRKRTDILQAILPRLPDPIAIPTFYKYRAIYHQHRGDRGAIAASFHRTTYNQTQMSRAQLHFVDSLILRYYARQPAIQPSTLYRIMQGVWQRTQQHWLDPQKCPDDIPSDMVAELLNPAIDFQALLQNPEKALLLTRIKLPSRSWVYQYLRWFQNQPEHGKSIISKRYGKDTWEREQMVFDTFVSHASLPLQYVFADHWLLDVFTVDEATRSQPTRLWLTLLLDAYSRCVLGLALLPENPNILSIQQAPQHTIWPKTSHNELGVKGDWHCYGIPQQLYLDNAWAHHSHSLEQLARSISQNGEYDSIDLVFRPPYKGRYGALVERFFGDLSAQVKQLLPGGILSSHPRDVVHAGRSARLLYTDIQRILHQLIMTYHHTPHGELKGMTPHQKWQAGMMWGLAYVPPQTPDVEQLFWRLATRQRAIQKEGISAFGMHYWSEALAGTPRIDHQGRKIMYRYRYDPTDLSQIAIFHEGQWVCEAYAKELRLPDGSCLPLSAWEREFSQTLARDAGQTTKQWLAYLQEWDALSQQRLREKQRLQRQVKPQRQIPDASHVEHTLRQNEYAEPDYTDLLAAFMSPEERSQ